MMSRRTDGSELVMAGDASLEHETPSSGDPQRFLSAGVEEALVRFDDPALLASGRVNLISLEAVETRFGERWPLRRDQVYDFTARVLERGVGSQGFFLRVSSTDFFIVHPDLGRVAGQAACLRYLREVLTHFLGEDSMAAFGVLQVTKIGGGHLEAQLINPGSTLEDDAESPASRPPIAADFAIDISIDRWTPFVASDGRQLRVSTTLEPVFELKNFTRIGFRMVRRVIVLKTEVELSPQQLAAMSSSDLLRIDLATIARGLNRLGTEVHGNQQPSLIVPISFVSLSTHRGRAVLAAQLKAVASFVKLGVICEVCDLQGVPPGALLTATSLVRPFALLVAGHLIDPSASAINDLRRSGLQALSFNLPANLGDAEFQGWAGMVISAAKSVAKSVLVYRAQSPQRAAILGSLGATHVSFAAN
jgi:hypothetical protein